MTINSPILKGFLLVEIVLVANKSESPGSRGVTTSPVSANTIKHK